MGSQRHNKYDLKADRNCSAETELNEFDTLIDLGGDECPICFNKSLIKNGRCETCQICGYSLCEV
jgi:hypothetical protein